jgi:hypothetical protein
LQLLPGMLIVSSAAAEVVILYDVHRFRREAESAKSIYTRSRAWPNSNAPPRRMSARAMSYAAGRASDAREKECGIARGNVRAALTSP